MDIGAGAKNEKEIGDRLQLPEIEQGHLPLHVLKLWLQNRLHFLFSVLFFDAHSSHFLIG